MRGGAEGGASEWQRRGQRLAWEAVCGEEAGQSGGLGQTDRVDEQQLGGVEYHPGVVRLHRSDDAGFARVRAAAGGRQGRCQNILL